MDFAQYTLDHVLDDLVSRFIINMPKEELEELERLSFQIEQAHWYYQDLVRPENPRLPSMSLKLFHKLCCQHPALHLNHEELFARFQKYKHTIPVCGAIIIDKDLEQILLVRGWSSKVWMFPRGKINKSESLLHCAVREVKEETNLDIMKYLVPMSNNKHLNDLSPTDLSKDEEFMYTEKTVRGQQIRHYFAIGVPKNSNLLTKTRFEISEIKWIDLKELPGLMSDNKSKLSFFQTLPFNNAIRSILNIAPKPIDFFKFDIQRILAAL